MAVRKETELIIVAGHGVCKKDCTSPHIAPLDSSWVGIFAGEGPFYIEHSKAGVTLAAEIPNALLAFSGGQTREDAGRRSEAESYWEIADADGWWGFTNVRDRAVKEEYARDSFENLLFGIALFKQETRRWPDKVTIVSWRFKERRYDLHRQALKWPKQKFAYVGVNDPVGEELPKALEGEKAKVESVSHDLFLIGPKWVAQREQRNPFHRQHPYREVSSVLARLFDFLDRSTFTGDLPWLKEEH